MNPPKLHTPGETATRHAAEVLAADELVILPTDTVYGIAADADSGRGVEAIFAAKQRPSGQPLQLLFSESMPFDRQATLTADARRLIDELGAGAWTLVVPAAEGWRSAALAGGATVGVRIPDHPVVSAVVEALGRPLAATSANRHGNPSPVTCAAAIEEVGAFCAVAIDSGAAAHGLDSTVVDFSSEVPRILREGAIDQRTVARILGLATIAVVRSVRPEGTR